MACRRGTPVVLIVRVALVLERGLFRNPTNCSAHSCPRGAARAAVTWEEPTLLAALRPPPSHPNDDIVVARSTLSASNGADMAKAAQKEEASVAHGPEEAKAGPTCRTQWTF
jgi:hypothetical protein